MSASPTLGVLVVPARGGVELEAALAAASWADAQVPLDLDGRRAAVDADWIVLLGESERIAPDGARAIRAAVAAAAPADHVFALPVVTTLLDMQVSLGRASVRVGPRGTAVAMRPGTAFELVAAGRRVRTLDVPVVRSRGATLTDALELAGAEATTFAALADHGIAPGRGISWHPLLAGVRALAARANGRRLGLGRWVLAVFEGYRVVVAYAKLWERRRDQMGMSA